MVKCFTSNCKRQVIDVFLFYNEIDLLELRLRCLNEVVDKFVVTECRETFSGLAKPMYFAENRNRYRAYEKKIVYNPIGLDDLIRLQGQPWKTLTTNFDKVLPHKHSGRPPRQLYRSLRREITHRDAAIIGLSRVAHAYDLVLLSDVDEIPNPTTIRKLAESDISQPSYFEMKWYLYWINNQVGRNWYGTVAFNYNMIEGQSLDMLRYASSDPNGVPGPVISDGGWHFSYLGGPQAISEKLAALPYQGLRSKLSIFMNRFRRNGWQKVLDCNNDILMQNRDLRLVPLDDSYPEALHEFTYFVRKYSHNPLYLP